MYSRNNKFDKAMTQEQFAQVVDAILAGKYSWACVLILRFAGYNPLHYIPYRTYNRLMKEHASAYHRQIGEQYEQKDNQQSSIHSKNHSSRHSSHRITDLNYMESLENNRAQVKGGDRSFSHSVSLFTF